MLAAALLVPPVWRVFLLPTTVRVAPITLLITRGGVVRRDTLSSAHYWVASSCN